MPINSPNALIWTATLPPVNCLSQIRKKLIIFKIMKIIRYFNFIYIVLNDECQIVKMCLILVKFVFALHFFINTTLTCIFRNKNFSHVIFKIAKN